jgi:hypothetical protein
LLAEAIGQLERDDPANHVGTAARGKRDNQLEGFVRKALTERCVAYAEQYASQEQTTSHCGLHRWPPRPGERAPIIVHLFHEVNHVKQIHRARRAGPGFA